MVKGLGIGEGQWECRGPLRTLENTSIQEEKKVAALQRQAQEKTVVGNKVLIESQLGKVLIQRTWLEFSNVAERRNINEDHHSHGKSVGNEKLDGWYWTKGR